MVGTYLLRCTPSNSPHAIFPSDLASRLGHQPSSLNVFRVKINSNDINQSIHYVSWVGHVQNTSKSVIIPSHQLNTSSIGINKDYHAFIERVTANDADDVFLKCMSQFDWEIASRQSSSIEQCMLRQHSITYRGQRLKVQLTKSLEVEFEVVKIMSPSCGQEGATVAKLSINTTLIIEPFLSTHSSTSESHELQKHDILKSSNPISSADDWDSYFPKLILSLERSTVFLRLLPQRFPPPRVVTSSDANLTTYNNPSESDATNTDELQQLVNEFVLESSIATSTIASPDQKAVPASSSVTVFTNPICFLSILSQSTGGISNEAYKVIHNKLLTVPYLTAVITTRSRVGNLDEVRPLTTTAIVRVVCTNTVRSYHISVSDVLKQSLGLQDYDLVALKVINLDKCVQRSPAKIFLQPVTFTSTNSRQVDHNEAAPTSSQHPNMQELRMALLRYREQNQPGSVLLTDGTVIALSVDVIADETSSAGNKAKPQVKRYECHYLVSLSFDSSTVSRPLADSLLTIPSFFAIDVDAALIHAQDVLQIGSPQTSFIPSTMSLPAIAQPRIIEQEFSHAAEWLHVTTNEILLDLLSSMLPHAMLTLIKTGERSPLGGIPTGLLVTGGRGSGKTSLLKSVADKLAMSPLLCANIAPIVDCVQLASKPVEHIIMSLSSLFDAALSRAPSVIVLDDLDALCPSTDASVDGEDSSRITSIFDKSLLVALHLQRLLDQIYELNSQAMSKVLETLTENTQQAIHDATCSRVYVIASASSMSSINQQLVTPSRLRMECAIRPLNNQGRIHVLRSILAVQGLTLCLPEVSTRESYWLNTQLEGLVLADLSTLSKRIASSALKRIASSISTTQQSVESYNATFEDLIRALENFRPSSRSQTDNASFQNNVAAVAWGDIGGMFAAKRAVLETLQLPVRFRKLFAKCPVKLPRGLLLYGPPGVGKTYLAHAAGKECGLDVLSVKGPQLLNKYIGASEKAVRDLFDRARNSGRPTLIIFDEFEALAPRRGSDNTGVTDRVVNQLLTFLDGVEESMASTPNANDPNGGNNKGDVYVMAITSRPDLVDVALLRPGRIAKHVYIGYPTAEERADILRVLLTPVMPAAHVRESAITELCTTESIEVMTSADLKSAVHTAYLNTVHENIEDRKIYGAPDVGEERTQNLLLTEKSLLEALRATRPSISQQDAKFYEKIYSRFRKSDEMDEASAPSVAMNSSVTKSVIIASNRDAISCDDIAPCDGTDITRQRVAMK